MVIVLMDVPHKFRRAKEEWFKDNVQEYKKMNTTYNADKYLKYEKITGQKIVLRQDATN